MIDESCEEILQRERAGHKRDIIFVFIVAMVAIVTVIALKLASNESQKGPSQQQLACEKSPWC